MAISFPRLPCVASSRGKWGKQKVPVVTVQGGVECLGKPVYVLVVHADGDFRFLVYGGEESVHDFLLMRTHLVHKNHYGLHSSQETVLHEVSFSLSGNEHSFPAKIGIAFHDGFTGDARPDDHRLNGRERFPALEFSASDSAFNEVGELPVQGCPAAFRECAFLFHRCKYSPFRTQK